MYKRLKQKFETWFCHMYYYYADPSNTESYTVYCVVSLLAIVIGGYIVVLMGLFDLRFYKGQYNKGKSMIYLGVLYGIISFLLMYYFYIKKKYKRYLKQFGKSEYDKRVVRRTFWIFGSLIALAVLFVILIGSQK